MTFDSVLVTNASTVHSLRQDLRTSLQIMDAAPAIISDGTLWVTTPLLAAAHIWSGHPLLAAGIWTAYGISALFPQGEALLRPLVESPLHYNFNSLHSPLCGRSPDSVIYEAPTYNTRDKITSVPTTPTASTSESGSTTQSTLHNKLISVTTVNATRTDGEPALIPTS